MNYLEIKIDSKQEELQELLISQLAEIGFDGFQQEPNTLIAIIAENNFNENELTNILEPHHLSFSKQIILHQNWNAVWESNFQPISINKFVGIRANFHEPIGQVEHEIIITPKMSFGTGHHATTYSVMQLMENINFKNKTVFDFGTGTGILAILAEKLGASEILAIDYDDWCIENANENILNNQCCKIEILKSDTAQVSKQFDVVIANINKNIIQDNFQNLHQTAKANATILLSGLLIADEEDILQLANKKKWKHQQTITKGDWIAIEFQKN
ncbi:MAG: 50S ribosomal protein L11 methyltransferase [Chitinophagaceae bacterium]|nr:50S ribosomal protein L11 methyltransferase [Chitinophagaceae bacterium]